MSCSSLWVMDKHFKGQEVVEFRNSWFFSPVVWGVLADKYIPYEIQTPYGFKKSIISDGSLFSPLNQKVNNCKHLPDRVCWELSNQQIFFTKDKEVISAAIREFPMLNENFDKHSDGICPLKQEHIIARFNEIADEISKTDEDVSPYFILKNTSCDDSVEYWFSHYSEQDDEYKPRALNEIDKVVAEFVFFNDGQISKFVSNLEYFK